MKRTRPITVVFAALVPVMLLGAVNGCSGCKKNDDDDAKPVSTASAAPAPTPTPAPSPAPVVTEEDAGAADAGTDAGPKPVGPGNASGSISKCCAALQQNANSAPLDQKPYYMAAASACQGMRNTPSAQQAFGQIRAFLAGAKMPGACK